MVHSTDGLKVLGFDPSLRNWGIAAGRYFPDSKILRINNVDVIQPVLPTGKKTRQNSLDLETAKQLAESAIAYAKLADVIFVEVPIGSQSARAMASYGVCVGVLGAIQAMGIPFFEITPTEVKLATVGNKMATKAEMIAWATSHHPNATWPTRKLKGKTIVIADKAEHMADAIGAIEAGITCKPFTQMLALLRA